MLMPSTAPPTSRNMQKTMDKKHPEKQFNNDNNLLCSTTIKFPLRKHCLALAFGGAWGPKTPWSVKKITYEIYATTFVNDIL